MLLSELEQKAFRVQKLCLQNNKTLAVAESLTGGLISSCLTLKPGASQFFLGAVVCYSPTSKIKTLQVPPSLIKKEGTVNAKVALLMAQGIKNLMRSDYALAITGVAGPGTEQGGLLPVGTGFVGFSDGKAHKALPFSLHKAGEQAERQNIQQKSAFFALAFLESCIIE